MTAGARFSPPFTPEIYLAIRAAVIAAGWGDDYSWSQAVAPPNDPTAFALELGYVIVNSGMKWEVARGIWARVRVALMAGDSAATAFGHKGKAAAIDKIWRDRADLLTAYGAAADKLAWLRALPWIGPVTCYHAAKNFGLDVAKPDVHLQRIADAHGETCDALCRRLAGTSGDRIATVDVVLWRAAATGMINTRSPDFSKV